MYVLTWRTVSALTRVVFCYSFPSLLRNSGNEHQYNSLVSTETIRHSGTCIIIYLVSWYVTQTGGLTEGDVIIPIHFSKVFMVVQ